jgi:hypothetical protein
MDAAVPAVAGGLLTMSRCLRWRIYLSWIMRQFDRANQPSPALTTYLLQNRRGPNIALLPIWKSTTMSEGIAYLLILGCVVGGPWLAMAMITKTKRQRIRHGLEPGWANDFAPVAPQRRAPTRRAQVATRKLVAVAGEQGEQEAAQVKNPVRALLPPAAAELVSESGCRPLPPALR